MRKIKDVLRLKLDANLSHRQIAAALGVSKAAVTKYLGLAAAAGLDWSAIQGTDEAARWLRRSAHGTMFSRTTAACTMSYAARA